MKIFVMIVIVQLAIVSPLSILSADAKVVPTGNHPSLRNRAPIGGSHIPVRSGMGALYVMTHGHTNMVRLGGTPTLAHGAAVISGKMVRPSGQINGQEFTQSMGRR